jgi:glycosyltransferase involved in cell wall biosynthesis
VVKGLGASVGYSADQRASRSLPTVSIGVPTYNRAGSLERTLLSLGAQTYPALEIVISDNASTDETQQLCARYQADDARFRYLRQNTNIGAEQNFACVLKEAHGELFMWLADDDWLDDDYVDRCARLLIERRDVVLVSGTAIYHNKASVHAAARSFQLEDDLPRDRVIGYYKNVDDNAVFYGVMRRALVRLPAKRIIGADWYVIASLAAHGKIAMLSNTSIHRSMNGTSSTVGSLAAHYGLKGNSARNPYVIIGRHAALQILSGESGFRAFSLSERVFVAASVYAIIYRRFFQRLALSESVADQISLGVHRTVFALGRGLRRFLRFGRRLSKPLIAGSKSS